MFVSLIFLIGASIGSCIYLSVVRSTSHEGFLCGRSRCDDCRRQLAWYDTIPLVSFILLRGKCRSCKRAINSWHWYMEFGCGLVFVFQYFFMPHATILFMVYEFIILTVFCILFLYDARYGIIPDVVVLPAIVFVVIVRMFSGSDILAMLYSVALGGGWFAVQYVVSKGRWIGAGDIRLGVLMGVLLPFTSVAIALSIAYIVGAVCVIVLLITHRCKRRDTIPFGVFLLPATLAVKWFI